MLIRLRSAYSACMKLSDSDVTDFSRSAGGVLLAAGAMTLYIRKAAEHGWGDFALMLVALVPAVLLYVLAISHGGSAKEKPQPWRSVLMVVSILLGAVALIRFLDLLGTSLDNGYYGAAVFLVIAAIGTYGSRRAQAPYAMLLVGISLLLAWFDVWGAILSPSLNLSRILLIVGAALLFLLAIGLGRSKTIGAREIATVAGIAAVLAGIVGLVVGAFDDAAGPIIAITFNSGSHHAIPKSPQDFGWDLYLLSISVVLMWIGSRLRVRGLGYVGGVGLLGFLTSVGSQLAHIQPGKAVSSSIVGWPLALILIGLAGLAAPALRRRGGAPTG